MSFVIGLGMGLILGVLLIKGNDIKLWYERKKSENLEKRCLDLTKVRKRKSK